TLSYVYAPLLLYTRPSDGCAWNDPAHCIRYYPQTVYGVSQRSARRKMLGQADESGTTSYYRSYAGTCLDNGDLLNCRQRVDVWPPSGIGDTAADGTPFNRPTRTVFYESNGYAN